VGKRVNAKARKYRLFTGPQRVRVKAGGPEEDRTPDLRIANAALSQLSYGPLGGGI
jgi:hypothetical protein